MDNVVMFTCEACAESVSKRRSEMPRRAAVPLLCGACDGSDPAVALAMDEMYAVLGGEG